MRQVPASVMILSICGVLLGMLGLLFCTLNLFGSVMMLAGDQETLRSVSEAGLELGTGGLLAIAAAEIVGLLLSMLLIIAGIGCYLLKPWARTALLAYAVTTIPNNLCLFTVYLIGSLPNALRQTATPDVPTEFVAAFAIACFGCFFLIFNIYPFCVLIFMNTASVKHAFETGGMPPPDAPWSGGGGYDMNQQGGYPQGYYPPPTQQPPQHPDYPYDPPTESPADPNDPNPRG